VIKPEGVDVDENHPIFKAMATRNNRWDFDDHNGGHLISNNTNNKIQTNTTRTDLFSNNQQQSSSSSSQQMNNKTKIMQLMPGQTSVLNFLVCFFVLFTSFFNVDELLFSFCSQNWMIIMQ
jgi:hypothetical protein